MNIEKLNKDNCIFINCDTQENCRNICFKDGQTIQNWLTLGKIANQYDIPLIITEILPEEYGPTIEELDNIRHLLLVKKTFSICKDKVIMDYIQTLKKNYIVLYGIASHVCIMHSCFDLISIGYKVFLVVDSISSKNEIDKEVAIKRMEKVGAILTTCDSIKYELMG